MRKSIKIRCWSSEGQRTYEITGEVVQLGTGVLDENGKEIYEGDIIEYSEQMFDCADIHKQVDQVIYDSKSGAFGFGDYLFTDLVVSKYKIIGNIFENPELLK